ncbi:LptF/LptG family permease [Phenylobacterium sp.]|uniref:LptF/LptG family permease n=1 Tax=Phenylobacterium sp. TaxID=1871053 RepID=UPI002F407071
MKLYRYVLKAVSLRILVAGLILLAVMQILDLLEVTPDIIKRGLGAAGMAHYAFLRLPRLIDQAAPLSVLTGVIFAFMKLAGDSQIVAIRASGVSVYRLTAMALPVVLAVMALDFVATEVVAPRTDPMLQAWWSATAPADARPTVKPHAFRVGSDVVVAAPGDTEGRALTDVKIYRRDATGRLVERIQAATAIYAGEGGWRLENPQFARFTSGGVNLGVAGQMTWASAFRPRDVRALFAGDQRVSAASAARALAGGGSERPPSYYATHLQRSVAHPLGALVMLILAAPVALANFRSGQGGVFVVGSLVSGLVFLVADGVLTAMGESGAVAPVLAAWTAPMVFAALGATALLKLEG